MTAPPVIFVWDLDDVGGGEPLEATEQQQMIRAIAERLVQVAPEGWARLVGNWEASLVDDEVSLNWITLGVVDLGDRWGGLVSSATTGRSTTWSHSSTRRWRRMLSAGRCSILEVDRDGAYRTRFGCGPTKRTLGVSDEESVGRFENYLDAWVAEHGQVPGR